MAAVWGLVKVAAVRHDLIVWMAGGLPASRGPPVWTLHIEPPQRMSLLAPAPTRHVVLHHASPCI